MLTQDELKKILHYNPKSGIFTRIIGWHGRNGEGKIAGCYHTNGYRYIVIKKKSYKASRLAFLYMEGYFPEYLVDHKDRNKSNDKWCNLRHVSNQCNVRNCGNLKNNTSGVKGVYWNKLRKRWCAYIINNLKNYSLGSYKDYNEAVCARLAGEQSLNWSGCDSSSPAFQYVKSILLE